MSLYTRARRHIDMDRVKELREENIKKEKIAEIFQQQQKICAELDKIEAEESKYVNWRKELNEGMTTSSITAVQLGAEGDVDLVDLGNETPNTSVQPGVTNVNGTYTFGPVDSEYGFASTLAFTQNVDLSRVDTIVFDFSAGDIDDFALVIGGGDPHTISVSSGRKVITIRQSERKQNQSLIWTLSKNEGDPVGTNEISGLVLQRRTPVNLFVGLDDPEASSFMRDGQTDNLSSGEKKKKLEEQLASSKEYLNKMFGEGMPNTATTIADYEPQQSFADVKISLSPEDLKAISDRVGGSYSGGKVDQKIAAAQQGPIRPGPRGYKKPGTYDPNKFYDLKNDPSQFPSPNLPFTGPGYSKGIDGTKVAASYPTTRTPLDKVGGFKGIPKGKSIYPMDKDGNLYNPQTGLPIKQAGTSDGTQVAAAGNPRGTGGKSAGDPDNIQWPRNKYPNKKAPPGPGYRPPTAKKKQRTMVAHHELEGEVIVEKKRLKSPKDLADKIPGYYDGKPAPLGFPIEEPPKMKNGMHPDLVDGKKTAKRFNRLDPVSAKAMPKTGNPHIDKKVKAAAKKPK